MALRERVGIGCILLFEVLDIGGSHCDGGLSGWQWIGGNWELIVLLDRVKSRDDVL